MKQKSAVMYNNYSNIIFFHSWLKRDNCIDFCSEGIRSKNCRFFVLFWLVVLVSTPFLMKKDFLYDIGDNNLLENLLCTLFKYEYGFQFMSIIRK